MLNTVVLDAISAEEKMVLSADDFPRNKNSDNMARGRTRSSLFYQIFSKDQRI